MKILALKGSPRGRGNSTIMLDKFLEGCENSGNEINVFRPEDIKINPCLGCLRCNLIKRCSIRGDDWDELSQKILDSDIIAISSPVYFFNFPSEMKRIIDRFRSFINVKITESGLIHTPWVEWSKKFVVLLSMGSPDPEEGNNIVDTMKFIVRELGDKNEIFIFNGTRLAVSGQIEYTLQKLEELYTKLGIPVELAGPDFKKNSKLLDDIYALGNGIVSGKV